MPTHDVLKFSTSLSAKLATRSRHVCAFLGAGAASACGLPDVAQLQERVLAALNGENKAAFAKQLEGRNLEQALSRLRRMSALLVGDQTLDNLTNARATALDAAVCQEIVKQLDLASANLVPMYHFAAWLARADYHLPVEVFTVNYDLLVETALEKLGAPYFDGFSGTMRARFQTELVEAAPGADRAWVPAFFVRLWKLHGSVNWMYEADDRIVRLGAPVVQGSPAAIYPSDAKYEESRRVPFVVLQDRLRRALHQSETLTIISGYSFGDAHLNELILEAASRRERSEFVVLCYSDIPEVLAQKATSTPNVQIASPKEAIIGGVRGSWKAPEGTPTGIWNDEKFALCDFQHLATYLARSAMREQEPDAAFRDLLEAAVKKLPGNG